jgi:hypothetical protein
MAKTICIDLDGTIAQYTEWQGEDHFGDPIPGVQAALRQLKEGGWTIIVYTTRAARCKIEAYLLEHEIPFDYINENPNQPPDAVGGKLFAHVYVDDRGLRFNGDWEQTLQDILTFRPWQHGLF